MSLTPEQSGPGAPSAPAPSPSTKPERPKTPLHMMHEPIGDDLSAEIDAAMNASMAAAPKAPPQGSKPAAIRGPRVVQAGREKRPGKVVSVGPTDIFIEFGPKDLGVIPRLQYTDADLPKVNDMLDVVVGMRDGDGLLVCSRPGSVQKAEWESLEPGQTVDAKVVGMNKGGLELEVANHRAFMPAGQVSIDHIADLSVFVGEKMTCQVVRVERAGRGNIVLSRREVLLKAREAEAEKLKATLAEGQIVEGTVRKIMPFGAFVDLGGVDGLVHVSDLTHDRIGHGEKFVARYVKEGEKLKVQILKIDWEAGRLSLGLKQINADPFATAANDIKEGAEITGRVTKLAEFGAFVEISPGVEGLVHISEMAWKRVGRVEEVVKPDEVVKAKVLKIDPETRRISLSIKALLPPPERAAAPKGKGGKERDTRTVEQVLAVTPELRRLREKFGNNKNLKGGIG